MNVEEAKNLISKVETQLLFSDVPMMHKSELDFDTVKSLQRLDFDVALCVIHAYFAGIALAVTGDIVQNSGKKEFVDEFLVETSNKLEAVIAPLETLIKDYLPEIEKALLQSKNLHLKDKREADNCLAL